MKKNINNTYKFGASLIALAFSLSASTNVQAQTCTTVPTCDELGYQQTSEDCSGKYALKCPFNNAKYYCGGTAPVSCTTTHSLDSCPVNASCSVCPDNNKYRFSDCKLEYGLDKTQECSISCPRCNTDGYKKYLGEQIDINCTGNRLQIHYSSELTCVKQNVRQNIILEPKVSLEIYAPTGKHFSSPQECKTYLFYQITYDERKELTDKVINEVFMRYNNGCHTRTLFNTIH